MLVLFIGTNQTDSSYTSCGHGLSCQQEGNNTPGNMEITCQLSTSLVGNSEKNSCGCGYHHSLLADIKFPPPIIQCQNSSNKLDLRYFVSTRNRCPQQIRILEDLNRCRIRVIN